MGIFSDFLKDKLLLFAICCGGFLQQNFLPQQIIYPLIALSTTLFLQYVTNSKIKSMIIFVYCIGIFFHISLIFFIPLLSYEMIIKNSKRNILGIIGIIIVTMFGSSQWSTSFLLWGLIGLSMYLKSKTIHSEEHKTKYTQLLDNSQEKNIVLQQQNDELIARQNITLSLGIAEERNRIARDIHDNVGHLLSSALLQLGAIQVMNTNEMLQQPLDQLKLTVEEGMNNIRDNVHDLHDCSLNLEESIKNIMNNFQYCQIKLTYKLGNEIADDLKIDFLMLIKEALANVMKHSTATLIKIELMEHPAFYRVSIQDNGGTSESKTPKEFGMGLNSMQERIVKQQGRLTVSTTLEDFQIIAIVPKHREE